MNVNKKYVPYVIGLPNMGVGLLWAMNMMLIPMLASTLTQSNFKLAALTSMGAFTGIFVQYIAGLLSDRSHFKIGRRKPFILMGAFSAAVFIILMPLAGTYSLLFIFSFIFYFSLNFYQGPYYSLIPEVVDDSQLGLANGFSKIISVLGSGLIFIAGPVLWNKSHSAPFILAAALCIVTVLATFFLVSEKNSKVEKPKKLSFDFIKFPSVMKLYLSVFFIFLSYGCITPFFVKYCVNFLKFSESTASTALLLLTVVGAAFAYPIGVLSDKVERRKVLLLGAAIFAVCLLLAVFARSTLSLYIILSFIGIGFIAMQITIYSILAEIVPPERLGEFMGILNMFISLSQFIANLAMGAMLDKFGFSGFFVIPAVIMFMAVIVIALSRFDRYQTN